MNIGTLSSGGARRAAVYALGVPVSRLVALRTLRAAHSASIEHRRRTSRCLPHTAVVLFVATFVASCAQNSIPRGKSEDYKTANPKGVTRGSYEPKA